MTVRRNEGIIFSGGTQEVGQAVAGTNAQGRIIIGGARADRGTIKQDLSRQLDELIRVLQERQATLPEAEYLAGDAHRIAAEVTKSEPDKSKLSSLLTVLEASTKDLASVASIVGSVKSLITGLFGIL